jgi:transcriptional regulator with XRE-family HTH domain
MIDENDVNQYAARQLLLLRQTTGISQKRLGEEVELSPQQVQKYERGHNRLSVGKAIQFAEAFDVSVLVFYPPRGDYHATEPLPPPTLRIIRLLTRIPAEYYDEVYQVVKAITKIATRDDMGE